MVKISEHELPNGTKLAILITDVDTQTRKTMDNAVLQYVGDSEYNVVGVGTFIGEMKPPAELMKTLQDRKLAEEGAITVTEQMKLEEKRQEKERQTALADSQRAVVQSEQEVKIATRKAEAAVAEAEGNKKVSIARAEAEAETRKISADAEGQALKLRSTNEADSIKLIAEANAEKITLEGEAQAEVTRKQTDAMGQGNYAAIQVAEKLAKGNLKLVPDIVLGGSGNSSAADSLMALLAVQQATGKPVSEVLKPEATKASKSA